MNIIYFYTEDTPERFPKAWNAIKSVEKEFDIHLELTSLYDDYSMWKVLCKYWGQDDLLMIDRSIVVTKELIKELIDCKESNCAHYFKSSKIYSPDADTYSVGLWIKEPAYALCFGREGMLPKYVTFAATGFTKIARKFQIKPVDKFSIMVKTIDGKPKMRDPLPEDAINLDMAVISNINSWYDGFVKFHVHRFVEHQRTDLD